MKFEGRAAIARRLLALAQYIATCRRRPSPNVLAGRFGVSSRTVSRDLAVLEEAGIPMPPRQNGGRV